MYKADGKYHSVSWWEHGKTVENLAAALIKNGLNPGDKVGILSGNRPHWTWADIAILSARGVTVPVYPTLASEEVFYVLDHSDVAVVFVENARQLEKISTPSVTSPSKLKLAVIMDGTATNSEPLLAIKTWDEFVKEGAEYLAENGDEVRNRRKEIDPESLATIVYTSGTTGLPKGVMLLHRNVYSVLSAMSELVDFNENDVALSFLPLAHVYERVGGQFLSIYLGVSFAYAESMEQVANNLQEVKPTFLNAVPRFYEKVYARVQGQIRQMPPAQQGFVRWAIALGKRATKQKMEAKHDSSILDQLYKAELRIADRLVFRKIRERFGGRLRMMTSGAAPLANDVHIFFEALGMPIVEGYGLTETSAPLCCNKPSDNKFRTVGKPLAGVEVKLAQDGELLVKGPNVFKGYYKNDEATAQAFEDGWFKTGDIAKIDEEGYITITDRKKDIIITAGGKHVAPQFIENLFKDEPLINHVIAYGDRRKYITGLITLNPDNLKVFAESKSLTYKDIAELCQNPTVRKEIERVVHDKNQNLARFQRIKKFVILQRELSIEDNDLTPTLKVKRKVVTEKYKKELDELYEHEDLEAQAAEVDS
jgi:long-chain acyl-CoA synthetase